MMDTPQYPCSRGSSRYDSLSLEHYFTGYRFHSEFMLPDPFGILPKFIDEGSE